MNDKARLFFLIASIIVGFDAAGAFASRLLHFDYGDLIPVTFCLYGFCGYLGFRDERLLGGFLAGLMAGMSDSTLGWAASTAIHPYTKEPNSPWSVLLVSSTVVVVTLVAGCVGFIGAVISSGISLMQAKWKGTPPS